MNGSGRVKRRTRSRRMGSGRQPSIFIPLIFLALPIVIPLAWAVPSFAADPLALDHLPLIAFLCMEGVAAILLLVGDVVLRRQRPTAALSLIVAGSILLAVLTAAGVGVVGFIVWFAAQFAGDGSGLEDPQNIVDVPMTVAIAVLDIFLALATLLALRYTMHLSRLVVRSRREETRPR